LSPEVVRLAKLLRTKLTTSSNQSVSSSSSPTAATSGSDAMNNTAVGVAGTRKKHSMFSYCWGASSNPHLVKALAVEVRSMDKDVWRDEDGSVILGPMEGDTDERMATALEFSDFVIIFISRDYKNRPNCRQEAQYAHQLKKKGKVQIIYVMMDPSYTTVSSPDCVDGWLGIQVGGALWYPLYNESQVSSTANEIVKIMGDSCKRSDNMKASGSANVQLPALPMRSSRSWAIAANAVTI